MLIIIIIIIIKIIIIIIKIINFKNGVKIPAAMLPMYEERSLYQMSMCKEG